MTARDTAAPETVRRAGIIDREVMAAIHAMAFPPGDAWSAEVFELQIRLPNVAGFIHPAGGVVLVRIAADEAEILTVAVAPEARRAGIGTALMHRAIGHAAQRGAAAVFLEVSETNQSAIRLYTGIGFRPVGRRKRYYPDGSDALVLRLDQARAAARA